MNKNLFFYKSYKGLADSVINNIQESWKDPFDDEPVILFSSTVVKKWFIKYWAQQKGIVANLQTPNLEAFLWNAMDPGEKDVLARPEMLTQVALAKLSNLNVVSKDEIGYMSRLVEIASDAVGKFREYELAFYEEFPEKWKKGEVFFSSDENEIEKWECELYCKMFYATEGFFGVKHNDLNYYTLPQLYYAKKDSADLFKNLKGKRIYLVGQFNVGKFYMDMFRKMEEAGAEVFYAKVTLTEEPKEDSPEAKNLSEKIKVFAAPSKLREIEQLYQTIWSNVEKGCRLDEMLVLIPNLDSYRSSIERVFGSGSLPFSFVNASEQESLVCRGVRSLLDMADAGEVTRSKFFALMNNPLIQTNLGIDADMVLNFESWVKQANIYREKFSSEGERIPLPVNDANSWSHGIKCLLLNRFTSVPVTLGETVYHPFGNASSSNHNNLEKFCSIIDELEDFIKNRELFQKTETDSEKASYWEWANLNVFRKWLAPFRSKEFEAERPAYASVIGAARSLNIRCQGDVSGWNKGDFPIIRYSILDSLKGVENKCGKLFLDGLSIAKFTTESYVPVKYLYMVGMNFNDFPGRNIHSSMELRTLIKDGDNGLPNRVEQRTAAFWTELSACENVYISYQSRDLKVDAEMYPASPVKTVIDLLKKNGYKDRVLTLSLSNKDDTDKYSWRRLYRHRVDEIFDNATPCFKKKFEPLPPSKPPTDENQLKRDLVKFLENPFEFQLSRVLKIYEDEDVSLKDLEPLELDNIQKAALVKELFLELYTEHYDEIPSKKELGEQLSEEILKTDEVYRLLTSLSVQVEEQNEQRTTGRSNKQAAFEILMNSNEDFKANCSKFAIKKSENISSKILARKRELALAEIVENLLKKDLKVWLKSNEFSQKGLLPKNKLYFESVKRELLSDIVYQVLNVKGFITEKKIFNPSGYALIASASEKVILLDVSTSSTLNYGHVIRLYIEALLHSKASGIGLNKYELEFSHGSNHSKFHLTDPEEKTAESILSEIKHAAYGFIEDESSMPYAVAMPCTTIGEMPPIKEETKAIATIDDFINKLTDKQNGLWKYPSEVAKLFSLEDYGLLKKDNDKFTFLEGGNSFVDWEGWKAYYSLVQYLVKN